MEKMEEEDEEYDAIFQDDKEEEEEEEARTTYVDSTGAVGLQFCSECNNMLYPKEDKANKRLLYACRNCLNEQPAENSCIYRNRLVKDTE